MYSHFTIRPLLAFVMLLIFTLSITPKLYLHDIFADHKHEISFSVNEGKLQISKAGYNCDCHTLVATSPFCVFHADITATLLLQYKLFLTYFTSSIPPAVKYFFELRGPPVVV